MSEEYMEILEEINATLSRANVQYAEIVQKLASILAELQGMRLHL